MKRSSSANSLYRLIYFSRRASAAGAETQAMIAAILGPARHQNQIVGVTGALIATNCGFAQVLEGSRDAVERVFERIRSDRRHCDVTVLSCTPADRRCFPHWPMAFSDKLPAEAADPVADLLTAERKRTITGGDILRLLEIAIQRESVLAS